MYKFFNVGLIILLGITMCACTDTKSNRVDEALAKKQKEEEKLKKRIIIHTLLLIIEKLWIGKYIEKLPNIFKRLYVIFIVMISFIILMRAQWRKHLLIFQDYLAQILLV